MSEKKFNSNNSAYLLSKFNHILSIQIILSVLMIRRSLTKTKGLSVLILFKSNLLRALKQFVTLLIFLFTLEVYHLTDLELFVKNDVLLELSLFFTVADY